MLQISYWDEQVDDKSDKVDDWELRNIHYQEQVSHIEIFCWINDQTRREEYHESVSIFSTRIHILLLLLLVLLRKIKNLLVCSESNREQSQRDWWCVQFRSFEFGLPNSTTSFLSFPDMAGIKQGEEGKITDDCYESRGLERESEPMPGCPVPVLK